jgi:hypothetical protein
MTPNGEETEPTPGQGEKPKKPAHPLGPDPGPEESEGSLRGSLIALLTPLFALLAGWVASWVAKEIPGVTLDKNQVVAFMIAATVTALGAAHKWLQGWQQHEQRVSEGAAAPVKGVRH